jgi:tetraacyldisaccharide 4'-kinase
MLRQLRLLLLPIGFIYGIVTAVRNWLFDRGVLLQKSYNKPVIVLGNLTVGGTGKTPHAGYIIDLLQPHFKVALVSRGYMRDTKGLIVTGEQSTAKEIGDEPMLLKQKFTDLTVVVSEKRVLGVDQCFSEGVDSEVVVLDDAYQHRYVKPGLSILLIDYHRPIWNDWMLPAGNLREFTCGKKRADMVIITKCPSDLSEAKAQLIERRLKLSINQSVFYTSMVYGNLYPLFKADNQEISDAIAKDDGVIALSAIASPQPFIDFLKGLSNEVVEMSYPDHYALTSKDMAEVEIRFNGLSNARKWIVTTEKDAVKLRELNNLPAQIVSFIRVLPIEPEVLFNQSHRFKYQILHYVRQSLSNQ